ncbi:MAG: hypothetical protein ABIN80_21585 [Dyadobacter sp.]
MKCIVATYLAALDDQYGKAGTTQREQYEEFEASNLGDLKLSVTV